MVSDVAFKFRAIIYYIGEMGGEATHFLYGLMLAELPAEFQFQDIKYAGSLSNTVKNRLYLFNWGWSDGGITIPDKHALTCHIRLPEGYEEETPTGEVDQDHGEEIYVTNRGHLFIGYHLCSIWRDAAVELNDKFEKLKKMAEEHWKEHSSHLGTPRLVVIGGH